MSLNSLVLVPYVFVNMIIHVIFSELTLLGIILASLFGSAVKYCNIGLDNISKYYYCEIYCHNALCQDGFGTFGAPANHSDIHSTSNKKD